VGPNLIVIGRVFREDSPKVLGVEHQQMVRALAPQRSPRDFRQAAKLVIDIATGQIEDREPPTTKDPASVERGRLGGKKEESAADPS